MTGLSVDLKNSDTPTVLKYFKDENGLNFINILFLYHGAITDERSFLIIPN